MLSGLGERLLESLLGARRGPNSSRLVSIPEFGTNIATEKVWLVGGLCLRIEEILRLVDSLP